MLTRRTWTAVAGAAVLATAATILLVSAPSASASSKGGGSSTSPKSGSSKPSDGAAELNAPTQSQVDITVIKSGSTHKSGSTTHPTSSGSKDPCTYTAASPPPGPATPVGSEYAKYGGSVVWQTCPGGSGGYVWIPKGKAAPAPPSAIDLARSAYGHMPLLTPVPSRYPSGTLSDGRPYTIVQTRMWFETSPGSWAVRSKTVCAGALCATAVAKPSRLTFDPGNGDAPVSCPGPGTVFQRPAGGSWVPGVQPQGCDYQYTRSSYGDPNGEVTSVYTTGWTVTWTASNGQGGTFNDLQTDTTSRFAVAELQSVVTGP